MRRSRQWSMTTRLLPRAWSPSGNRLYDPKFDNLRVCQPWLLLELGSYVLDLLVDTLEGRLSLLHPALSSPVVVTDRLSDRLLELSYGVLGFVRYLVSRSHLRTLGLFQACPADRKQAHEPTSSVSKPSPQGMLHSRMVESAPATAILDDRRQGQIVGDVVRLANVMPAPKRDRDQMTFRSMRMTTTTRHSTARPVNLRTI